MVSLGYKDCINQVASDPNSKSEAIRVQTHIVSVYDVMRSNVFWVRVENQKLFYKRPKSGLQNTKHVSIPDLMSGDIFCIML